MVTSEHLAAAAQAHRKADGTYSRDGLQALADATGVSLVTVRRAITAHPEVAETGQLVIDRLREQQAQAATLPVLAGEAGLLQALAVTAGHRVNAHKWAVKHLEYGKSYRQFVRDIQRLDPALTAGASHGYKAMVDNRVYLTNVVPHRNHTWNLDHTLADLWVLPDRGEVPFRPWITMVVDGATDVWMAVIAHEGHPNTERITAALTRAAVGDAVDRGETPTVGGLPVVVVFDNAREHLAQAVEEGCLRLGIIASPTTPYHSWENGRVETAHGHLASSFLATLPGYSKGGVRHDGTPRFAPRSVRAGKDKDLSKAPTPLLRFSELVALLEEHRILRNASVRDRHGMTPMDRWNADTTAIVAVDGARMLANLTVAARKHTVNKSGIRFQGHDYISVELGEYRKRQVTVRHLPTVKDWIEVFDDTRYIGRAWLATSLPEDERNRITLGRARMEQDFRRIERAARQHRAHAAMAAAEGWNPEDLPEEPALIQAVTGETDEQPMPVVGPRTPARRTSRRDGLDALAEQVVTDGFELDPNGKGGRAAS